MFFCSVQLQPKPSSPNPDTVANRAQLERIRRINGLLIGLVRGDSTQRAPHVRIKNLQAIHVASINPAEPAKTKALAKFQKRSRKKERAEKKNLPFTWRPLEVGSLIAVLGINPVRINRAGHIILLHDYTIEVDKSLGNHVQPLVCQTFRFLLVSVP